MVLNQTSEFLENSEVLPRRRHKNHETQNRREARRIAPIWRVTIRGMETAPRLLQSEALRRCTLNECHAACCLHGVWVDTDKAADILAHAADILPCLPPEARDSRSWFTPEREPDPFVPSGEVIHTRVVEAPAHYGGTACIFLRPDYKCALQVAGEALGLHPWHFKPFYCILHPLDLDEEGRLTLDETRLLLEEPASCLRPSESIHPLREIFAPELAYLGRLTDKSRVTSAVSVANADDAEAR